MPTKMLRRKEKIHKSEFEPIPLVFEDPLDQHKKVTKDSVHLVRLENLNKRMLEIGARIRLVQMDNNGDLTANKKYKGFAKYLEGELDQHIV